MPLTVSAAADWLQSLLKVESSARDRLATLKATMLSMAAKFGLDHGQVDGCLDTTAKEEIDRC